MLLVLVRVSFRKTKKKGKKLDYSDEDDKNKPAPPPPNMSPIPAYPSSQSGTREGLGNTSPVEDDAAPAKDDAAPVEDDAAPTEDNSGRELMAKTQILEEAMAAVQSEQFDKSNCVD